MATRLQIAIINYIYQMKKSNFLSQELAILGGGQLGLMLIQKAYDFNIDCSVLEPDLNAPCKNICKSFTNGSLNDFDSVYNFGKDKKVLTIEIEHVNVEALQKLENEGVKVYPQPKILKIIQDKGLQKQFYKENNIPTAPFSLIENASGIVNFPIVQKLRKGGYDGKGVQLLKTKDDLNKAFNEASVLEEAIAIEKEIAVIVARNVSGEIKAFPAVEMEFNPEANLVEFLFSPAAISKEQETEAEKIACEIAQKLGIVGLLAVELFVTKDNKILVNEIAPRPHNSGHQTIEGNITSQYEQHLRAIFDMPLGDTSIIKPSVMVNLLGEAGYTGEANYLGVDEVMKMEGAYVHLYGKKTTKPFRKMGHVTVVNDDLEKAKKAGKKVIQVLKIIS